MFWDISFSFHDKYFKADIISVHGLSRQSIFMRSALTGEDLKVQYFIICNEQILMHIFIHIYIV